MMLRADEIRWSLDEPEPATRDPAVAVHPPAGLTASRADLVVWWRWRYATLLAENVRLADLLVLALRESQSYREALQAAFDALADQTDTTHRQRRTIVHLRDECRRLREPVKAVST